MRIGFALPQVGSAVGSETLVTAAQRAEDLGFDSLWVLDRILWPISPRAPYPIGDGPLETLPPPPPPPPPSPPIPDPPPTPLPSQRAGRSRALA